MERRLLTERQLGQMVDAHSIDEAYKIAGDAGIGAGIPVAEFESALRQSLLETYELAGRITGVPEVFDLFRYEYDALNLKILVKAQALSQDSLPMMTALGTVAPEKLHEQFRDKKWEGLPQELSAAAEEAEDVLARTGDPQLVDILLDRGALAAMVGAAQSLDIGFLQKLVRARVDVVNIRSLVRIRRMDKDTDFFKRVAAPGGSIGPDILVDTYSRGMDQVVAFLEGSSYGPALEAALPQIRSGSLSLFEKLCDNILMRVVKEAKLIAFGVEPAIAYVCAKENEARGVRIVLASRLAGVAPELIKERLRETYA